MEQAHDSTNQPSRSVWIWLFQPFHFIAGGKALGIGLILMIVAASLANLSNSHFDGVLDFHTGRPAPYWLVIAEVVIDWIVISVLLLAGGLIISPSRFRLVDLFGTQALARFPMLAAALLALIPGFQIVAKELAAGIKNGGLNTVSIDPAQLYSFYAITIVSMLMIVWMVVLMYKAFSISCNVSRAKAIAVFIICLIAAEVISKIGIGYLFQTVQ